MSRAPRPPALAPEAAGDVPAAEADLVLTAPGRLQVRRARPPARPLAPGQALVQVDCVSLCGSDYRLYRGTYGGPRAYPIRFGHEWAGRVVDAGPGAEDLLGAAVTGDCSRWCGACDRCAADRNLCRHVEKFGITIDGFSTRWRTVEARYLYPDPYGLDPRLLALAEPFAVALHGLDRLLNARPAPEPLLIIGAGALGLCCLLAATRHHGLREVHLLEADPARRALLRDRFPGLPVLGPEAAAGDLDGYAAIAAAARYPAVVECAGAPQALDAALTLAAPGGAVLALGLAPAAPARTGLIVTKGLTVHGSIGGTGAFPEALRFLSRHGAEVRRLLLTGCHPATDAARALADGARPGRTKTQIRFEGTDDA